MNPFDKIIGYETIRKELERTADALRDPARYARLGAAAPRGLLLHGRPGVGKTLMASCLIEAAGRKAFTCRKDRPDGEFVDVIRQTFEQASREAPSVVFLDDLDKFANDDQTHRDSEEYVTVQSCIDEYRQAEIFVLATANDPEALPRSLIRPGRFDRIIEVKTPAGEDAVEIVRHYLKGKTCVAGVNAEAVAGVMACRSCADLETAINKAGLIAGFEGAEAITMRHLMLGCFDVVYGVPPDAVRPGRTDGKARRTACHEAGHALVSELLSPGSVSAVCLYDSGSDVEGITFYFRRDLDSFAEVVNDAVCAMGGRMAMQQVYGEADLGGFNDLHLAYVRLAKLAKRHAAFGFRLLECAPGGSEEREAAEEKTVSEQLEVCGGRAARLIAEHRDLLDALTDELLRKGVLMAEDVRALMRSAAA